MKIRVLEVLATLKRAGAENMAVSLASRLDRGRFEVNVVSLFDEFPGGLEPVLAESGIGVWHLGKRPGFDPRMFPRLASVYRKFRPDVIHTHSYVLRYALPAGLLGRAGRIVHTVHNLAEREVDAPGRLLQRFAFRRGVIAVAIAEEVARSFRRVYGMEPAANIPNGIDTSAFVRPGGVREAWRRQNGFSPHDLLFTSVARLDPQKDPLALIEAFARALGEDGRCRLLLAGDGSLHAEARGAAAAHGISGRVHFLGVRADVPDLLAASDVFVLASRWEGNPISVMEAAAAGLPVIATAVGGVPELIEEGKTGLLAPPGDTAAFGRMLYSLAFDPRRRRELGEAARRHSARFDIAAMTASYSELFERAARRKR